MLSSEFSAEMGSLIRSLEQRVVMEPGLKDRHLTQPAGNALEHVERAIVSLVALHIELRQSDR